MASRACSNSEAGRGWREQDYLVEFHGSAVVQEPSASGERPTRKRNDGLKDRGFKVEVRADVHVRGQLRQPGQYK